MIILDTNHLSVLKYPEDMRHKALVNRMESSTDQDFAIPIVAVEEQLRGWLAVIHQARKSEQQIAAYGRLARLIAFLSAWKIISFDGQAAERVEQLRKGGVRIGTMDLRIAAIALANEAMLLTANLTDFRRVPGLKSESWL